MQSASSEMREAVAPVVAVRNGQAVTTASMAVVEQGVFRQTVSAEVLRGARVVALFGRPTAEGRVRLTVVLGRDEAGTLGLLACDVDDTFVSLVPECPQTHWFEREIEEVWKVKVQNHPWPKPIRFQPPRRGQNRDAAAIGVTTFFRVEGAEVHEVAVGPVHAGIIEPGHFRFQCHGERVLHLEISLGYQHRGIESALVSVPRKRHVHYMETCAGDTTVGHTLAYCQAMEALAGCRVPARALALRGIALELERVANHTGDLGALAGDIGYLPTASYCGRLRGDVLNMTALVCGNRFGRNWIRPGGVAFDVDEPIANELVRRLDAVKVDLESAVDLLWASPSVLSRFDSTGQLSKATCRELGLVGPAARAVGIEQDVRQDYPCGIYRFSQVPVSTWGSGDVYGRAFVRWLEIQRSLAFVREQVRTLPQSPIRTPVGTLRPSHTTVSLVEGWRGEIAHVVSTSEDGGFLSYKLVDSSFHNWFGLAMAMRGQPISDFPLCNKSFNLSYCGHDL